MLAGSLWLWLALFGGVQDHGISDPSASSEECETTTLVGSEPDSRDDVRMGIVHLGNCEPAAHRFPEVLYVVTGTVEASVAEQRFVASEGTVMLVNPGTFHAFVNTGETPATLAFFRWAPGGSERVLHAASTMTEPVAPPSGRPPEHLNLRRYQDGAIAATKLHAHSDSIAWTTNWTYSEDLWPVYRYKPLVRAPLADWGGIPREDVRMGVQELDAGASYPAHHHPSPEIYFVLSGRARWTVGENRSTAGPGSAIVTPPNASHRIDNVGADRLRWIYFWWAPGGDASVFE